MEGYISILTSLKDVDQTPDDIIKELISSLSNSDSLLRQTSLRGLEILGERVLRHIPYVMTSLLVSCCDKNTENSLLATK